MSLLPAYLALSAILVLCEDAPMLRGAEGRVAPAETLKDSADREEQGGSRRLLQLHRVRPAAAATGSAESTFSLKIQVKDIASRQFLSQAFVEVFMNHTRTNSALTADNGVALLKVPYQLGMALTIVASMDGYILMPLPWKTSRLPIFSSVTLSLFPQNQGNIWLFEDSVMITGKVSDALSQPSVQFPQNLLKLPDNRNISSMTAYLTVPRLPSEKDRLPYAVGILINKSGFRNMELSPVAAISTQLLSDGKEIQVTGPIQITVPLAKNTGLRPSDAVPAWAFDMKTGAWVNQGLGMVKMEEEGLVWSYVAPHLGYWIAAPLPSSRGSYMGHETSMDFISYHTYLLMAILGGTLIIVIGFLTVLLCYCSRGCTCEPEKRRVTSVTKMAVLKRDQTTSTNNNGTGEVSFKDSSHHDDRSHSRSGVQREDFALSKPNFNIYVEDVGLQATKMYDKVGNKGPESTRTIQSPIYVNSSEVVRPKEMGEQKMQLGLNENVFFQDRLVHVLKQPMAILQAPELFHTPEQLTGCKSATLPRKGQVGSDGELMSKDSFTQTLPKISLLSHLQQQGSEDQQVLEGPQGSASNPGTWGRYSSLLESVSVPGTLNEAVDMGPLCSELQGISEQTLLGLSKGKPSQHPRAWFVSLEGKPAAQVRHSIIDLQKRHMPSDSNDTSLDSGVDMNEHQQGRRLEREKTFVKTMPHSRALYAEDLDLSSSESGTTAACTPEDVALRNILDSGSGSIPNIPEERDGADTSSAQEDSESRASPPPRRLRKVRDRGKVDKQKSTWHLREERPLMKLN
ncbi:protein FAM171B isoform X1 [Arapaima gigas]